MSTIMKLTSTLTMKMYVLKVLKLVPNFHWVDFTSQSFVLQLPSLEERLKNINLDNAEELWSALTASERQEFEAIVKNGEAAKMLPPWNPWWTYSSEKKLVEDLTEKSNQDQTYRNNCPKVLDPPVLEAVLVIDFAQAEFCFSREHEK